MSDTVDFATAFEAKRRRLLRDELRALPEQESFIAAWVSACKAGLSEADDKIFQQVAILRDRKHRRAVRVDAQKATAQLPRFDLVVEHEGDVSPGADPRWLGSRNGVGTH